MAPRRSSLSLLKVGVQRARCPLIVYGLVLACGLLTTSVFWSGYLFGPSLWTPWLTRSYKARELALLQRLERERFPSLAGVSQIARCDNSTFLEMQQELQRAHLLSIQSARVQLSARLSITCVDQASLCPGRSRDTLLSTVAAACWQDIAAFPDFELTVTCATRVLQATCSGDRQRVAQCMYRLPFVEPRFPGAIFVLNWIERRLDKRFEYERLYIQRKLAVIDAYFARVEAFISSTVDQQLQALQWQVDVDQYRAQVQMLHQQVDQLHRQLTLQYQRTVQRVGSQFRQTIDKANRQFANVVDQLQASLEPLDLNALRIRPGSLFHRFQRSTRSVANSISSAIHSVGRLIRRINGLIPTVLGIDVFPSFDDGFLDSIQDPSAFAASMARNLQSVVDDLKGDLDDLLPATLQVPSIDLSDVTLPPLPPLPEVELPRIRVPNVIPELSVNLTGNWFEHEYDPPSVIDNDTVAYLDGILEFYGDKAGGLYELRQQIVEYQPWIPTIAPVTTPPVLAKIVFPSWPALASIEFLDILRVYIALDSVFFLIQMLRKLAVLATNPPPELSVPGGIMARLMSGDLLDDIKADATGVAAKVARRVFNPLSALYCWLIMLYVVFLALAIAIVCTPVWQDSIPPTTQSLGNQVFEYRAFAGFNTALSAASTLCVASEGRYKLQLLERHERVSFVRRLLNQTWPVQVVSDLNEQREDFLLAAGSPQEQELDETDDFNTLVDPGLFPEMPEPVLLHGSPLCGCQHATFNTLFHEKRSDLAFAADRQTWVAVYAYLVKVHLLVAAVLAARFGHASLTELLRHELSRLLPVPMQVVMRVGVGIASKVTHGDAGDTGDGASVDYAEPLREYQAERGAKGQALVMRIVAAGILCFAVVLIDGTYIAPELYQDVRVIACGDHSDCADTVGDACTRFTCTRAGECIDPVSRTCDDHNACTDDTCDPERGCMHTHGSACLLPELVGCRADSDCDHLRRLPPGETGENHCLRYRCDGRVCREQRRTCDDNDLCTRDSCDPATGLCVYQAIQCKDSFACTQDVCDQSRGCVFPPIQCPQLPCTAFVCDEAAGGCVGSPIICRSSEAGNATCAIDYCDEVTGCRIALHHEQCPGYECGSGELLCAPGDADADAVTGCLPRAPCQDVCDVSDTRITWLDDALGQYADDQCS